MTLFEQSHGHAHAKITFEKGEYVFGSTGGFCRLIFNGSEVVPVDVNGAAPIHLEGEYDVELIAPENAQNIYAIRILEDAA